MSLVSVYLSLGSNLGQREENISRALGMLDYVMGCHWSDLSNIIETDSWGFDGPSFLNAVVLYYIDIQSDQVENQALDLLDKIKGIEAEMGRCDGEKYDAATGRRIYESRPIDIDILFLGVWRIDNPRLSVPHKLISERDFVLKPLREIAKPSLIEAFPEYFQTN